MKRDKNDLQLTIYNIVVKQKKTLHIPFCNFIKPNQPTASKVKQKH